MLSWPPATMILASPLAICCSAERHRAQARAAHLVQPEGRLVLRHARLDRRLTGRVLALVRGQDLAEDHFIDLAGIDLGAGERRLDHGGAELMRGRRREGAVERPHGRTRRAHDNNLFRHWGHLLDFGRTDCTSQRFSAMLHCQALASHGSAFAYHNGRDFSQVKLHVKLQGNCRNVMHISLYTLCISGDAAIETFFAVRALRKRQTLFAL